jgi:hypothetical protein
MRIPRSGLDLDEEIMLSLEQVYREHHLPPGTSDLLEQLLDLAATLFQFGGDPEDGCRTRGIALYLDVAGAFLHALFGRFVTANPEHSSKSPALDFSRTRRF